VDATPPPFFISQGQALAIAAEDVPWVVPYLIAEGGKVMIAGPQKSLKTFLALDLTRARATGGGLLGRPLAGGADPQGATRHRAAAGRLDHVPTSVSPAATGQRVRSR
jgi:hypothetical protein